MNEQRNLYADFSGEQEEVMLRLWSWLGQLSDELGRRGELIARLASKHSFDNALRIEVANVRATDARRYREQGYSLKQTAQKMGTSPRQVSRWLARPRKD